MMLVTVTKDYAGNLMKYPREKVIEACIKSGCPMDVLDCFDLGDDLDCLTCYVVLCNEPEFRNIEPVYIKK